jgi:hypothetical protein
MNGDTGDRDDGLRAAIGARMRGLWAVLAVTTGLLLWRYPEQTWVLTSKLNRIALGAALGVAIDRAVFGYARPNSTDVEDAWMYRRVVLIVGGMLAAALAL